MRDRLAHLGALLIASCAATPGSLRLAPSPLALDPGAPPPPRPPDSGANDSVDSREVRLEIDDGRSTYRLAGWCRAGVWTTLEQSEARRFVLRESWGRLGQRAPRLLARVEDDALGGIVARLRPEADGSLSFHVEVSEVEVLGARTVGIYHGQRVVLAPATRRGFRFSGLVPAGHEGVFASWRPGVVLGLSRRGEGFEGARGPAGAIFARAAGADVMVPGRGAVAETFVEEWNPRRPVHVVEEGIERMDFRLVRERRAAGLSTEGARGLRSFGTSFEEVPSG